MEPRPLYLRRADAARYVRKRWRRYRRRPSVPQDRSLSGLLSRRPRRLRSKSVNFCEIRSGIDSAAQVDHMTPLTM